jgi:hypothetical protein
MIVNRSLFDLTLHFFGVFLEHAPPERCSPITWKALELEAAKLYGAAGKLPVAGAWSTPRAAGIAATCDRCADLLAMVDQEERLVRYARTLLHAIRARLEMLDSCPAGLAPAPRPMAPGK